MATRPRIGQLAATGASDGDVPVYDAASDRLVMGPAPQSGVAGVTGTGIVDVDNTDPENPIVKVLVPLTTAINGVPELVWDSDNNLIFTEAP